MADVVIFGTGSAGQLATVYFEAHSRDRIVAYTVDREYLVEPEFLGKPVMAWDELAKHFPPDGVLLLGPLSPSRLNRFRRDRYLEAKQCGYRFINFVHPSVECLEVEMGENCFVLGRAVLEPYVKIGNNVIVWSNAHIGHHSVIGDHCFIGPGAGIGGRCSVGELSFFGPKADISSGVHVGRGCLLGPRAKLRSNAPDDSVFLFREGTPKSKFDSEHYARWI